MLMALMMLLQTSAQWLLPLPERRAAQQPQAALRRHPLPCADLALRSRGTTLAPIHAPHLHHLR